MRKFIIFKGKNFPKNCKDLMVGTANTLPYDLIKKYPEIVNKKLVITREGEVKEVDVVYLMFVLDFIGYDIKETFNSTDGMSVFAVL
jgi:hypothetical protein